jgi:hypothetical protein
MSIFRAIGSPGFELDEAWLRRRTGLCRTTVPMIRLALLARCSIAASATAR